MRSEQTEAADFFGRVAHRASQSTSAISNRPTQNSTPATDGRIVVTWFWITGCSCLRREGAFLWKVDLAGSTRRFTTSRRMNGAAISPIIWNNLVILQCDTQTDSYPAGLGFQYRQRRLERLIARMIVGHTHRC